MKESNREQYNSQEKMKIFKNINQSALNYVQPAIENVDESSKDATQNLVNIQCIMNKSKISQSLTD